MRPCTGFGTVRYFDIKFGQLTTDQILYIFFGQKGHRANARPLIGHPRSHSLPDRRAAPSGVWSRADFLDIATPNAVEKALQRLSNRSEIRRREKGIGRELKIPLGIIFRGDTNFTNATEKAAIVFQETGRDTAAAEIREALKDISRRPVDAHARRDRIDGNGRIGHSCEATEIY